MAFRTIKMVLIGDTQTGKSAVLHRITLPNMNADQLSFVAPTIGVEFGARSLEIDDQGFNLQFWDASGQERFQGIVSIYYRDVEAAFLFYNIENENSFKQIDRFIHQAKALVSSSCVMSLVGTRSHTNVGVVTHEMAIQKARDLSLDENLCFEVSAETGEGIEEMLAVVARKVMEMNPLTPVVNESRKNATLNQESFTLSAEPEKKSALLSFLNKHKWAILFGLLLTAGIVAVSVVFWPVIVGSAAVSTAAAAITALTTQIGFSVSATAFAATAISVAGAAVVTLGSFIFDKIISGIKNYFKPKVEELDPRYFSPTAPVEGRGYADIAKGVKADLSQQQNVSFVIEPEKSFTPDKPGASGFNPPGNDDLAKNDSIPANVRR